MVKLLGGSTKLLELYRLVVVVCEFEKVNENECRPISLPIPKPISAFDSFWNPVMSEESGAKIGRTRPSLNPTRGVYSNSKDTEGRIRAFTPKPNDPVCLSMLNSLASGSGGKKFS